MKYLFGVNDLAHDTERLYYIEAENAQEAERLFVGAFLPHVSGADFTNLVNSLADGMDIIISNLGPMDQIKEL